MKKLLVAIALALSISVSAVAGILEHKVYDAGVVIFGKDAQTGRVAAVCSGSAISKTAEVYMILTAAHCVADVSETGETVVRSAEFFISPNVAKSLMTPAEIVFVGDLSSGADVAFLKGEIVRQISVLEMQSERVADFEEVLSAATPLGMAKLLLKGSVSAPFISARYWGDSFLMSLPDVAPGASGAAVVCRQTGKICGILVGLGANGSVVAIPSSIALQFKYVLQR